MIAAPSHLLPTIARSPHSPHCQACVKEATRVYAPHYHMGRVVPLIAIVIMVVTIITIIATTTVITITIPIITILTITTTMNGNIKISI